MNNRCRLLVALGAGALATLLALFGQPQANVWRVGFLTLKVSPSMEVQP